MTDALLTAIYRGDAHAVEELLDPAVVLRIDEDGRSALMHAILAATPDVRIVRALLRAGSSVDLQDRGQAWTALHFAARDQRLEVVELLLASGAAVDSRDAFGNTPLWRACMNKSRNIEVIRRLLCAGADPNAKNNAGVSPIETARRMGDATLEAELSADLKHGG